MKPHLPSILSAETLDRRIEISFHPSMRPREPPFRSAAMGPGMPVFGLARLGTGSAGRFSVGTARKIKQHRRDQTRSMLAAGPNLSPQRLALGNP